MQVKTVQYGLGERGPRSVVTDALVCGDETFSDEQLARNRASFGDEILAHPLDDEYHKARSPIWDKVTVPFLSAANWGGQGLHPRGNFEGFVRAASRRSGSNVTASNTGRIFTRDYGRRLQKAVLRTFTSRARRTAGINNQGSCCRFVTSIALSSAPRNEWPHASPRHHHRAHRRQSLPIALLDEIALKTDGIPLFVEELTKTVLESGELRETAFDSSRPGRFGRLAIPSTLHDSLIARLDRLQPVKEVAQAAACIGREFDFRLLAAILPLKGDALQDALRAPRRRPS